jgi:hypothetical protein
VETALVEQEAAQHLGFLSVKIAHARRRNQTSLRRRPGFWTSAVSEQWRLAANPRTSMHP